MLDVALRGDAETLYHDRLAVVAGEAKAVARTVIERFQAGEITFDEAVQLLTDLVIGSGEAAAGVAQGFLSVMTDMPVTSGAQITVERSVILSALTGNVADAIERVVGTNVFDVAARETDEFVSSMGKDAPRFFLRRTRGATCGLCVAAATRPYYRAHLRPIHDHCDCVVRPVLPGEQLTDLLAEPVAKYQDLTSQLKKLDTSLGRAKNARKERSRASNVVL